MSVAYGGHEAGAVIQATSVAKPTEHCSSNATATFKSQFRGLSWDKKYEGWRVRIYFSGKQRHVGRYADEISAAKAYDKAAVHLYGRSAITNFGLEACKADCTTEVSDFIITAKTVVQEQPTAADQRPRHRTNSNNWQHHQQQQQLQQQADVTSPGWPFPAAALSTPHHQALPGCFAGAAGHAQQQQQVLMQQVGECAGPMQHAQQFGAMQPGVLQQGYPAQSHLMHLMQAPQAVMSVQDQWAVAAAAAAAAGQPQQQQLLPPDGVMLATGSPVAPEAALPTGSAMFAAAAAPPAAVLAQPDASLLVYSGSMGPCGTDPSMGQQLLPVHHQQQQLWGSGGLPAVCGPLLQVPQHSALHAATALGPVVSTGVVGMAGVGWQGQWMVPNGQVPGWS